MQGVDVQTGQPVELNGAHPVAELFPRLQGDELEELVESIRAQGLLTPVVVDQQGLLLDGRNRVAACERLGLQPSVARYTGDDPGGYALAVNVDRRHLTQSQRAIIIVKAQVYSENTAGVRQIAHETGVNKDLISKARTVLEHAPDLAEQVVTGTLPLSQAYQQARERRALAQSEAAQLQRLRDEAPAWAERVERGEMSVAAATAGWQAEQREELERCESSTKRLVTAVTQLAGLRGSRVTEQYVPELASKFQLEPLTPEVLVAARAALDEVESDLWTTHERRAG